jgi:hypothetical protein
MDLKKFMCPQEMETTLSGLIHMLKFISSYSIWHK